MRKEIFVLGGINMDIAGVPARGLALRDSNIGEVRISAGGVGRNIAENLARMGFDVELVAPLGGDEFARMHERQCESLGIGLRFAPRKPDFKSGVYLCVNDGDGDMYVAVNDMGICGAITADDLPEKALGSAAAVVLDANLPEEALLFAARAAGGPVTADPVSAAKAGRLKKALPYIHTIKPNRLEAAALTGEDTSDEAGVDRAISALLRAGVKRVFVSLGPDGIRCGDGERSFTYAGAGDGDTHVENTTGAGDSVTAALTAALISGLDMEQTARLACRVAGITVKSPFAVSEELDATVIDSIKGEKRWN